VRTTNESLVFVLRFVITLPMKLLMSSVAWKQNHDTVDGVRYIGCGRSLLLICLLPDVNKNRNK